MHYLSRYVGNDFVQRTPVLILPLLQLQLLLLLSKVFLVETEHNLIIGAMRVEGAILLAHIFEVFADDWGTAKTYTYVAVATLLLDICKNLVPVGPAVPAPHIL